MYTKETILWPTGKQPDPALCSEDKRLAVLAAHGTDALSGDPELTQIAQFAASLCNTPIGSVTVVEAEQQRFLAQTGLDIDSTPRSQSFCAHAMLRTTPLVVEDATKDPAFAENALVTGEANLRFYAGFPLVSTEGAPLGALCVIDTKPHPDGLNALQREGMDVLAKAVMRRMSQMRLGQSAVAAVERGEEDLRDMIDSVPGIAWMGDNQGNFRYINARWREMTGIEPPTDTQGWQGAIHPDDWDRTLANFQDAVSKRELFEDEWRMRMADGSYRWVHSRAVPVVREGQPVRWFGTVIDIDKTRRLSEARDLLASELSHRIKNIFAVVSGLITLRARENPQVRDFAEEVNAAIRALGTAHDYVRPDKGRGADSLRGLMLDLLAPYQGADERRIAIIGDDVAIAPRAATPLALIFHELATNAAKYGALSDPEGAVTIHIETDETRNEVRVSWKETASEQNFVAEPDAQSEGFGSRMLRLAVEGQLGGEFDRVFAADGLMVTITVPIAALNG